MARGAAAHAPGSTRGYESYQTHSRGSHLSEGGSAEEHGRDVLVAEAPRNGELQGAREQRRGTATKRGQEEWSCDPTHPHLRRRAAEGPLSESLQAVSSSESGRTLGRQGQLCQPLVRREGEALQQ